MVAVGRAGVRCAGSGARNMLVSVCLVGLVAMVGGKRRLGTAMDDDSIKTAAEAWVADAAAAEGTYGHISAWDTSQVTSMAWLFDNTDFNEDISAWDISAVTSMEGMFYYAHAFEHDLGWCVEADVKLTDAFRGVACADPTCGVTRGAAGTCAPTPAPSPIQTSSGAVVTAAPFAFGLLGGAVLQLF